MTASSLNKAKLYPSFTHFKGDVYKADTVEKLNVLVSNLKKARISSTVHAFTKEEITHAWNLIRWKGVRIPGAYEIPSDRTWRVSTT